MGGHYESRFAALAAKNLIGWRDQVEQTVTGGDAHDKEHDSTFADWLRN